MQQISTARSHRRALLPVASAVVLLAAGWAGGAEQAQSPPATMTLLQAVVLGVVEGLTEYLPVSSTGHLILAQRALAIPLDEADHKQAADAFAVCIQAGAILAVLGLYRRRVGRMLLGVAGRDRAGLVLARNLVLAFLPAAVVGLLLNDWIKQYLFGLWPVVAAWAVGGVVIVLVAGRFRPPEAGAPIRGKPLESMTWNMALAIGLFQCLAMWPGTSRALVTILGGLLIGLELAAAVEFSFLLGVLTLGAATCYDAIKHGALMLEVYQFAPLAAGTVAAFVSAVCAVKWMVHYLQRHDLRLFGWYRIVLAIVVAGLLLAGWMHA